MVVEVGGGLRSYSVGDRLELSIEYSLSDAGLRVASSATNVGSDACPYGSGAHPYLRVGADTVDSARLQAPGRTVLQLDGRGVPVSTTPVDGTEFDFRQSKNRSVYPYIQLFTGDSQPSVNRRSLAVEPMTCPPNAFRSGEGALVLQPGESTTAQWGIRYEH